jgi:hypothetical protein
MYEGLAVVSVWFIPYFSGWWRPSADWVDRMGRVPGFFWIAIGLAWTSQE